MPLNFPRILKDVVYKAIARGKSILLLGPRQTGKTTLVRELKIDLGINLILPSKRQQYEKDPSRLLREVEGLNHKNKIPLILIDEIQLVPNLMDICQYLIDEKIAQFILTGSSARRLTSHANLNLLPGRVVYLRLDPLTLGENKPKDITEELYFGALPGIRSISSKNDKTQDLLSYVETYLEEEIRKESKIRNLGVFSRFLELAAIESGNIINYTSISNEIGVSSVTVQSYFKLLEECLICERIDPLTESATRKKLTKAHKYLFFDLGVRRLAAGEGESLGLRREGQLFEQWVGLQLLRLLRLSVPRSKLLFWNDPSGPEVDFVVRSQKKLIPIEVKYTANPTKQDAKHLFTFLNEYSEAEVGYIICQVDKPQKLSEKVMALPWSQIDQVLAKK